MLSSQKITRRLSPLTWAWICYGIVSLVWGTTYAAIKVAVEEMPPFYLSGVRHVIAATLFLGFFAIRGEKLPPWRDHWRLFVAGLFMIVGGNGFVCWAEQSIPAGLTAIISAIYPLVTTLLAILMLGQKINYWVLFGLLLGVAGMLIIFSDSFGGLADAKYLQGNLLVLSAVFFWSFGSLFLKRYPISVPIFFGIGWQMLYAALVNLGISFIFEPQKSIFAYSVSAWEATFYLVFFGSVVGYICFYYMLDHLPAAQMSTYSYWNTLISVFISFWFMHEALNGRHFLALAVTLVGALVANYGFKLIRDKKSGA